MSEYIAYDPDTADHVTWLDCDLTLRLVNRPMSLHQYGELETALGDAIVAAAVKFLGADDPDDIGMADYGTPHITRINQVIYDVTGTHEFARAVTDTGGYLLVDGRRNPKVAS